ncbi:MAG: Tim44/TimA family putative adaptor protein [Alphaproteobacteria bacterium]|nr:Tim44/TimA family putative adaptor protein [Alphaproteobacteria bacterium]
MTGGTFVLGLLTVYIIWKLYRALGEPSQKKPDKIRLVSKETGEVLEMQIVQTKAPKEKIDWNENAFLTAAKFVFQKISTAFANCDLKELKRALAPDVYRVFEADILSRQAKKQKMDFSLICFDSADIVKKTPNNDEITVRFKTEQINLLKDEKGKILEGDGMSISVMMDTWVFKQIGKEAWIVTSTQSQVASCTK